MEDHKNAQISAELREGIQPGYLVRWNWKQRSYQRLRRDLSQNAELNTLRKLSVIC